MNEQEKKLRNGIVVLVHDMQAILKSQGKLAGKIEVVSAKDKLSVSISTSAKASFETASPSFVPIKVK